MPMSARVGRASHLLRLWLAQELQGKVLAYGVHRGYLETPPAVMELKCQVSRARTGSRWR